MSNQGISNFLEEAMSNGTAAAGDKAVALAKGIFHVTGNFASAAEALEAGSYDIRWGLAETPADIPLIVQPVDCMVKAVPLGRIIKTGELFEGFPRIADPMTLFALGVKFPEEQREAPHFTVWRDARGQFWCAVLGVSVRERDVNVARIDPDVGWLENYRLLVRECPPQADK